MSCIEQLVADTHEVLLLRRVSNAWKTLTAQSTDLQYCFDIISAKRRTMVCKAVIRQWYETCKHEHNIALASTLFTLYKKLRRQQAGIDVLRRFPHLGIAN